MHIDYERHVEYINNNSPFMNRIGIRITKVEKDRAEGEAVIDAGGLNYLGSIHGGMSYALADSVVSAAARSDGYNYVTLSGEFDYIRGVGEGRIRAIAEVRHRGRNICRVGVKVLDEKDRLLADGHFTMYCLHEPFLKDQGA